MPHEIAVTQHGTRSFAASCRRCGYEFIASSERAARNEVVAHESECSDETGEWRRYDFDAAATRTLNGRGLSKSE